MKLVDLKMAGDSDTPKPKCKGHSTITGKPCGNYPLKGATVCRKHGGAAPQVKAAARKRAEEEKAAEKMAKHAAKMAALFGAPREVEPSQALVDLVQWTAGEVEFWRDKVRKLAEKRPGDLTWGKVSETEQGSGPLPGTNVTHEATPHVYYRMLYAAQDRLATYATAALKAGVEERRVRLAEQQGDLVANVIERILNALDLSPEQAQRVPQVVPRELRLLAGVA